MDRTTRYSDQSHLFEQRKSPNTSHSTQNRPGTVSTSRSRHHDDQGDITEAPRAGTHHLTAGPASQRLPGSSGSLDRVVDRFREATEKKVRDACQEVVQAIDGPGLEVYSQRTSTHFHWYDNAKVQHIIMHKKDGIEFTVAFNQPEPSRNLPDDERRAWWDGCDRFQPGTAVCVLDTAGSMLGFFVSKSTLRRPEGAPDDFRMDGESFNLSGDRQTSYVNLKLSESSQISDALRWRLDTEQKTYLLEFPGLALASFRYTLEAIRRQFQSPHRLVNILNSGCRSVAEKPAYARTPGFAFNLDCLMRDGQSFQFDSRSAPSVGQVSSFTDLDPDQVSALLEALSSELALVCGRPGTGKSFFARKIIKVLLRNRENANLGPIVCLFPDDAALDRMVEELLDDGIDGIVRMGGLSTSARLQSLNLPETSYRQMSRQDKRAEKQLARSLDKLVSDIERQLLRLGEVESPWEISRFLSRVLPRAYEEVFGPRHGDFSRYQPSTALAVQQWLAGDTADLEGRHSRHKKWLRDMRDQIIAEINNTYKEYERMSSELPRFHDNGRRLILQGAQVVAVTTTEAVKCPELLHHIQAKALVCDDAEKFLESQVLTAILPSTEHVILIGNCTDERLQRNNVEHCRTPFEISFFEQAIEDAPSYCPRLSRVHCPFSISERRQPCERPKDCGHECHNSCDSDMMHEASKCTRPCTRPKPGCDHACALACGEPCEETCHEVIDGVNLRLPCGHFLQSASCQQLQEPSAALCEYEVDYQVPGCGHRVKLPCHRANLRDPTFRCQAECGAALPCGNHVCQRKCHECNSRYGDLFAEATHNLCDQPCGKSQPECIHSCQRVCHGDSACGPCRQPCDVSCSHGSCERLCFETCMPCLEDTCASGCPHSKCTMPCAAPCDWVPCSRRCPLPLSCGHQCPSLCGETCPDARYCQSCGPEDILWTTIFHGSVIKEYRDIDLDEDPCVFPHCGHIQTRSTMDEQLDIKSFYKLGDDGAPSGIKDVLRPFSVEKIACCGQCRGSLREISRYGRLVRRAMLDKSLKNFIARSNDAFSKLADRLTRYVPALTANGECRYVPDVASHIRDLSINVKGDMQTQVHTLRDLVGGGRYADLAMLYDDIQTLSRELEPEQQVFQRIADMTSQANERNKESARSTGSVLIHEPLVQPRSDLVAMDLALRCSIAVMADFYRLWKANSTIRSSSQPTLHFDMASNFGACRKFIDEAEKTKRYALAAQGHISLAWFCGFALAVGLDASSRVQQPGSLGTGRSAALNGLRARGEEHLVKALEIHQNSMQTSRYLEDRIQVTRDFLRSGNLGNLEDPRATWYTVSTWKLDGAGPLHACENGHPLMDLRKPSRFLGQLLCNECGLIVRGREHASAEGESSDENTILPSQGETLVDI